MVNKFNFCPNIAFTFLEMSKFKVESLLRMRRNTCDAWYEILQCQSAFHSSNLIGWFRVG